MTRWRTGSGWGAGNVDMARASHRVWRAGNGHSCVPAGLAYVCVMRALLACLVVLFLTPAAAHAQEDCARPWVVVVKKDGGLVEGWLVKDVDSGVLVDVSGHTVLVPEPDIKEVVEDCGRQAPKAGVPQPTAPLATRAPREADSDGRTRNAIIDMAQAAMRWSGGACLSIGGGLFTTGLVIVLISAIPAIVSGGFLEILPGLLIILGLVTAVSAVFVGSGAGLFLGAQLTNNLRAGAADMD